MAPIGIRASRLASEHRACLDGRAEKKFTDAQRNYWAFQKVVKPAVPSVKGKGWVRTPVDAFILAKLEEKNLKPNPPADKVTLLRRAYFDLIGLPPTPEQVQAFRVRQVAPGI